ncbi:hypothetical protein Fcan01_21942 [Folsomia candida]|uniref:Uncharacterized protein n=1 Tax=Folsomia candida TaxID=158441 RepID=A0A226DBX6_FOLCA|nr:hypothetical protein Fcan01_21942 [Folsomia candida]
MSSPQFSSKFSVVEFLEDSESKPKSTWKKLEAKIVRSILWNRRANSNVDEARVLSSGEIKFIRRIQLRQTIYPLKHQYRAKRLHPRHRVLLTDFTPMTNSTTEEDPSAPGSDLNISEVTQFVIHTVPSESDNRPIRGDDENDNASKIWASSVPDSYDLGENQIGFVNPIKEGVSFLPWITPRATKSCYAVAILESSGSQTDATPLSTLGRFQTHDVYCQIKGRNPLEVTPERANTITSTVVDMSIVGPPVGADCDIFYTMTP